MSEAKEKDRILAQIKAFTPIAGIDGLNKHLPDLERDGMVNVWSDEKGNPISVRLTQKGQMFSEGGGYCANARADKARRAKDALKSSAGRIVEAIIIAALTIIVAWWLNSRYGVSDSPVGSEQKVLNHDSTSLSLEQSLGLNADSTASRGKSEEACRDSSRSTLDKHSVGIPVKDISVRHSPVLDESKPTPSGR